MRLVTFALACGAFAAAAAAQETGAGLRVETRPGGGIAIFASPTEAQAACTGAGGNFGLENGRFVCVNPRSPLRSTRTEVAPPAAAAGPETSDSTARGIEVESLTLRPGEHASFTLAQGYSHQLLRSAAPSAPGAITVAYEVAGGRSRITATSRTGHALRFTVLADPDGNGSFSPMGEIALPGDGTPATRSWPGALGAISIGNFARP